MASHDFRVLLDISKVNSNNAYDFVWITVSPSDTKTVGDLKHILQTRFSFVGNEINLFLKEGLLLEDETILVLRDGDTIRAQHVGHNEKRNIPSASMSVIQHRECNESLDDSRELACPVDKHKRKHSDSIPIAEVKKKKKQKRTAGLENGQNNQIPQNSMNEVEPLPAGHFKSRSIPMTEVIEKLKCKQPLVLPNGRTVLGDNQISQQDQSVIESLNFQTVSVPKLKKKKKEQSFEKNEDQRDGRISEHLENEFEELSEFIQSESVSVPKLKKPKHGPSFEKQEDGRDSRMSVYLEKKFEQFSQFIHSESLSVPKLKKKKHGQSFEKQDDRVETPMSQNAVGVTEQAPTEMLNNSKSDVDCVRKKQAKVHISQTPNSENTHTFRKHVTYDYSQAGTPVWECTVAKASTPAKAVSDICRFVSAAENAIACNVDDNDEIQVVGMVNSCKKKKRKRHRKRKVPINLPTDGVVVYGNADEDEDSNNVTMQVESDIRSMLQSAGSSDSEPDYAESQGNFQRQQNANSESKTPSPRVDYGSLEMASASHMHNENIRNYADAKRQLHNVYMESRFHRCHDPETLACSSRAPYHASPNIRMLAPAIADAHERSAFDYTICPLLTTLPPVRTCIAFKTLELDETYSPVVSDYRTGVIEYIDPITEELTIKLTIPEIRRRAGKFENIFSTDRDANVEEIRTMTVPWPNVIEARLIIAPFE